MLKKISLLLCFVLAACGAEAPQEEVEQRIVTVGGDVTEIVYALGAGDRIVATDSTSVYPAEALETEKIGYVRRLSAEGVLATNPDMILISGAAGPEEALEQIRDVGVEIVEMPTDYSMQGIIGKVRLVAEAIGEVERGEEMVAELEQSWSEAQAEIAQFEAPPRALFFSTLREGVPQAAGQETAANGVIELLGGTNLFGSQSGYTAISSEAAVAANPDMILVMTHDAAENGGFDGMVTNPAITLTDAVARNRVFMVDSVQIMQFGPRTPDAIKELAVAINEGRQAFEAVPQGPPRSGD
ncbi:MAG: ABC transporter substrate-binding protein [Pseudomonadota bacterium]